MGHQATCRFVILSQDVGAQQSQGEAEWRQNFHGVLMFITDGLQLCGLTQARTWVSGASKNF
jgi:hypothetical protein